MNESTFLRRALSLALVVVSVAAAAGCVESPASPTTVPAFSKVDLREGEGSAAAAGNVLTVHYTGWLYDASKTDSKGLQFATSRGGDPFSLTLGIGAVIEGWDQGLVGMKAGGLRRLVIPPSLAYGSSRNGPIPPNTSLVFEVELVSIDQ